MFGRANPRAVFSSVWRTVLSSWSLVRLRTRDEDQGRGTDEELRTKDQGPTHEVSANYTELKTALHNMRVLHVGKFYPPASGGMERVVQLLCEGERRLGTDSRVLVVNKGSTTVHETVNGVPVTRVAQIHMIG